MRWYSQILLVILAFAFFTRIVRLHTPERYIFDEVYHAVTAKLIARDHPSAYEWWNPAPEKDTAIDWLHPPVAKYTQAASIRMFGETTFGWRFSSVVFGTLTVFLTAVLAYELFQNEKISLLAAALASLDGLLLVQSRIAMNDIHVAFFILLTLVLFLKWQRERSWKRLILVAISAGLAMATKWSGLFVLAIVLLSGGLEFLSETFKNRKIDLNRMLQLGTLALLPPLIYVASYAHMYLQGKTALCWPNINNPPETVWGKCYEQTATLFGKTFTYSASHLFSMHHQIWGYQTNLEAEHPYQSRPWQWFLNVRPVWYAVEWEEGARGDIYAFGNPMVFLLGGGAAIATLIYALATLNKSADKQDQSLFFLLLSYILVWVPWQFSPRIMFFYHYAPAVPLMSILAAYWGYRWWSWDGKKQKDAKRIIQYLLAVLFVLTIAAFVIWYPHWTGIPVSNEIKNELFFALEGWE